MAPNIVPAAAPDKADTLARLAPLLRCAKILPQVAFSVDDWRARPERVLSEIQRAFVPAPVVVRSSARGEDAAAGSLAGRYASVLDVDSRSPEAVRAAVQRVVDSYEADDRRHRVLVQPAMQAIALSGVVCTREPDSRAPYYIFNYDASSGRTDTVTSGRGSGLQTFIHSRFATADIGHPLLRAVHRAVQELERLQGSDALDVEFGVTASGEVHIFQVRPLVFRAAVSARPGPSDEELACALRQVREKIERLQGPHPYLCGTRSVFGVMPDWNPAEIIGVRPRRLALSLYKELVTDNVWAYQRDNYGYRSLRSFPLMVSLAGLPYIDVRVSFNSFIPADLQEGIAERLVNWYMERLVRSPDSHDKVEFDIVFSCYTFDLDERLEALSGDFSHWDLGDLRSALRRLTNRIIEPRTGLYRQDLHKMAVLEQRRERILRSPLEPLAKIYWLLEDCKRYGTLPFAGLARAGFIAVQLLRSLGASGILTQAECEQCLASMQTVARRLSRDATRLSQGALSREAFLAQYGHLRPGTYDILSKRYDEAPERYLGDGAPCGHAEEPPPFAFSERQRRLIDQSLRRHGIAIDPEGLLQFLREAIEGREQSKFVFTHSLSDALQLIGRVGEAEGFDAAAMSHLDVTMLLKLQSAVPVPDLRSVLARDLEQGEALYEVTTRLKLPPLICGPDDILGFELKEGSPNFVTSRRIIAETVEGQALSRATAAGRIIFIESADPGYDWIFAHGVAGLVTMYGGTNSHMAIRAAELGIPAVIGCGEKLYRGWQRARMLEIDAANRQVRVVA